MRVLFGDMGRGVGLVVCDPVDFPCFWWCIVVVWRRLGFFLI